jgi:hypothetical protein
LDTLDNLRSRGIACVLSMTGTAIHAATVLKKSRIEGAGQKIEQLTPNSRLLDAK